MTLKRAILLCCAGQDAMLGLSTVFPEFPFFLNPNDYATINSTKDG